MPSSPTLQKIAPKQNKNCTKDVGEPRNVTATFATPLTQSPYPSQAPSLAKALTERKVLSGEGDGVGAFRQ